MKHPPLSAQEQALRAQSRRRMLGAFVLMLVVVLFLPMMLDHSSAPKLPSTAQRGTVSPPPPPPPAPAVPSSALPSPVLPEAAAPAPAPSIAPQAPAALPPSVPAASPSPVVSLPAPAVETPVTAAAPSNEEHHGQFLVQVGVFKDHKRAQALSKKLEQSGLQVQTEEVHYKEGVRVRIRVGPLESRAQAGNAMHQLDQMGIKSLLVTP